MTRKQYGEHASPFSRWLRTSYQKHIGSHTFSCQNLDYIWHNYRQNWLITIEEKRFGGMRNKNALKAQNDTHGILVQMLRIASGAIVKTLRGLRKAEYRGHYNIVFDAELPEDGMTINGERSSIADLVWLLKTGELKHWQEDDKQ
jgi:hypothetical protein